MDKKGKAILFLCAALLPEAGCLQDDGPQFLGYRTRTEIMEGGEGARLLPKEAGPGAEPAPDTVLFACGVEWEEGYDWHRDTAAGMAEGRLVLLRRLKGRGGDGDFIRLLEVPAGPGRDALAQTDLLHLLGGRLYSECCCGGRTVFCCDGKRLFTLKGSRLLVGLLLNGEGVPVTLWIDRSGSGISLMEGTDEAFSIEGAVPFGSMSGPGFGRTGALHEDGGAVCFSFFRLLGGVPSYHMYIGGSVTQVTAEGLDTVRDMRMSGGRICILGEAGGRLILRDGERDEFTGVSGRLEEAYIFTRDGRPNVCITGSLESDCPGLSLWCADKTDYGIYPDTWGLLLSWDEGPRIAAVYPDGSVYPDVYGSGAAIPEGKYHFQYPGAVSLCGNEMAVCLSSTMAGGASFVRTDRECRQVPFKGCLTGVEYIIMKKE